MQHQPPLNIAMLFVTGFLWVFGHITLPPVQDLANWATFFAGVAAGISYIYNLIKKRKK